MGIVMISEVHTLWIWTVWTGQCETERQTTDYRWYWTWTMRNGIVKRMSPRVVEIKLLSEDKRILIPWFIHTPSQSQLPFKFEIKQFPLRLCFAMIINKSQGQSVIHVGLNMKVHIVFFSTETMTYDFEGACFHSWTILCGGVKGQICEHHQGDVGWEVGWWCL